jgi:catechol 2,3-dioxygenase-like lactoylglutathione lyase family enzyme
MDWKLEVVVVPVSDVDRAIRFYRDQVGFALDLEMKVSDAIQFAQLTPPGSGCSITVSRGLIDSPPGAVKGLQLVVSDVSVARDQLIQHGVEVSPIRHVSETGEWLDGHGGPWNAFVFFSDPDGNSWAVQEKPAGA